MRETPEKVRNQAMREALGSEHTPQEMHQWRAGGKRWQEFEAQLTMLGLRNELCDSSREALRSVFLGEKPAVFLESRDTLKRIRPIIEATGLSITHGRRFMDMDYIYDPARVEQVIRLHPEVFPDASNMRAAEVMESLVREWNDVASQRRGLVLGFPNAAVHAFTEHQGIGAIVGGRFYDVLSKDDRTIFDAMFATHDKRYSAQQKSEWMRQKLDEYGSRAGISSEQMPDIKQQVDREAKWQAFGAHGFTWMDFADSIESRTKEQRIKDAFVVSGLAR